MLVNNTASGSLVRSVLIGLHARPEPAALAADVLSCGTAHGAKSAGTPSTISRAHEIEDVPIAGYKACSVVPGWCGAPPPPPSPPLLVTSKVCLES